MTAMIRRGGANWMNAMGREMAVPATLRAARWAIPVQALTAKTGPARSRENVTAADSASKATAPSRIEKTEASDRIQFSAGHAVRINPENSRKMMKAIPGWGFLSDEAKLARIAAPAKARSAAKATATRKKLRTSSARKSRECIESRFSPDLSLASSTAGAGPLLSRTVTSLRK